MNRVLQDLEQLRNAVAEGKDPADLRLASPEVSGLARHLSRRYTRLDALAKAQSRKIKTAQASLSRAKLEKEQYKSSLNELQKILDLCRVISSAQDLKTILHHLLFLLEDILPSRGCAVFIGEGLSDESRAGGAPAPVLASNLTPRLRQVLDQHFEEGIIRWILNERRVCLVPSFEDPAPGGEGHGGDYAIIPLSDNDSPHGFIWIACAISHEQVTPETTSLVWVLSSQASVAILNCLHRRRMEEKIDEMRLLTSISALKSEVLRRSVPAPRAAVTGAPDGNGASANLPAFFAELQGLLARELRLQGGVLLTSGPDGAFTASPALPELTAEALGHVELRKLARLADKDLARLETGDFFASSCPALSRALGWSGIAVLSLFPRRPDGAGPAAGAPAGEAASEGVYYLQPLSHAEIERVPALQTLLPALVSQARVVAESVGLYDSLLAANRNLTAMQWQLVHSGKMAALGQLAGGVAHEINNPLQIMLGRIQMIQMMAEDGKADGKERVQGELNLVTEEILRIRDIVKNLLDFSRQGAREAAFAPVAVNDVLREVLLLLGHQLQQGQVDVRLDLDAGNPRLMGNKNQLKQVFINLLVNAVHAMENAPKVLQVATRVREGSVEAVIRDSGVGIPKDSLHRIFEPFYTTKEMGTGLGLSISYGIVKDHKGTIEVESQESRGTSFTVRIPRLSDEEMGFNLMVG